MNLVEDPKELKYSKDKINPPLAKSQTILTNQDNNVSLKEVDFIL